MKNFLIFVFFSFSTEFLRHAPCMKHVKREYELCSSQYQDIIMRIGQSASSEMRTREDHEMIENISAEEARRREMCWYVY